MVRKDGAEARKERLQRIAQAIQAALHKEGQIPLFRTMAAFQYDFGLTRERVEEYLEILENIGQFVIDKQQNIIKKANPIEPN
jgi:predicted GNAT family acetyltransferase